MSEITPLGHIDGARSKHSKAVVIAVSKPPSWRSPFKPDQDRTVANLNFENIFVYNFYTLDERTRYSFKSESDKQKKSPFRPDVDTAIRDITGRVINEYPSQAFDDFNRTVNERIPSYVRLAWEPPPGFESPEMVASEARINAFKYMCGLLPPELGVRYPFDPISTESFELQQQDYVAITNEYLDMFSFDGEGGNQVNNWFAEEVDSSHFQPRLEFLYNFVLGPDKEHKNFTSGFQNITPNACEPVYKNTNGSVDPSESIVQTYDSALLEDLNLPIYDKTIPEDTTVVLNTDYSWSVSRASSRSSGMLLNMQTRMRNVKYWQEILTKSGISKVKESSQGITYDDVFERTGTPDGPLENIMKNAIAYQVENINSYSPDDVPDFKLAGFVIEKTQKVETEKTTINDSGKQVPAPEEDEVRFSYEKFPLIFIPCQSGGTPVTSYLDTSVNYDKEYDYSIRAVYSFSLRVPIGEGKAMHWHYFLNSPHSTVLTIETREVLPPPYPRDVWAFHEYYSGEDGCLALHWAFPVAKQRDVTYFAIFRRKSIYEPFQLLQIYDFNYSISDPDQSAREIKAVVIDPKDIDLERTGGPLNTREKIKRLSASDPKTMFKDKKFKPDTDYIYAVCAIDAHGQMSNYSSQIRVRLDSKVYKLEIQQISPPGAPLVFPNYFIKTKAFQDVARAANYRKATLRFRPDYKKVSVDRSTKNIVNGIDEERGGNESNCYFLQIINPDRANDIVLKYQIDDRLIMENNEEELRKVAKLVGIPLQNLES